MQEKIKTGIIKRIAISRTDAIGDVILTLPLAGYLKSIYPGLKLDMIGRQYTVPIINCSQHIDQVVLKDDAKSYFKNYKPDVLIMVFPDKEVAKLSQKHCIKLRIGTAHRLISWLYLNRRIFFSRKKSDLHEAQLNFKLLKGLGIQYLPTLSEISHYYGFIPLDGEKKERKIILHPKSKGSARDWPLSHYKALIKILLRQDYEVYITGTSVEKAIILEEDSTFFEIPRLHDKCGAFTLNEFIEFIRSCDGLIACSTGPLHIASAFGLVSLGLYPPVRPMHPGRWAPLGKNAHFMTGKESCLDCPNPKTCECMWAINPEDVAKKLQFLLP